MKGYKVFKPDWTCRGFQYEVGKEYTMEAKPDCCNRGFHFCTTLADCFFYNNFNPNNKVAEIEAFGEIDENNEDSKAATNGIRIVKELTWEEVLRMVNTGNSNSGNRNSGDCNSGNCNSGNWNSGNWNSGDWNSGNRNSGNYHTGCFNTEKGKMMMFNQPSNWTLVDWWNSDAKEYLNEMPRGVLEWIYAGNMTDEEKNAHPEYKTTGGYLKVLNEKENAQNWWDSAPEYKREAIQSLPNFDAEIFEKCTGIKI